MMMSMMLRAMISAENDESSAPQFAMKPSDTVVKDGESVILHCAANGRDRSGLSPKVIWLRDGSTIDLPYVDLTQCIYNKLLCGLIV